MDQRIVYLAADGSIGVIVPVAGGLTIEQIAAKDVPAGRPYAVVDAADIPDDRSTRDLWTVDAADLAAPAPGADLIRLRPAPAAPVPTSITRRQCAREMLARELITGPEAVAMVATATPPALVETLLAALPASEAILARIDFAAGAYERGNPLLVALMTAQGATPADIDDFFRAAVAQ